MGLVNADYKYLCLEVGGHRYMSDAQMFNESELKDCLVNGTIGLPPVDALITERDMLEDDDSAALLSSTMFSNVIVLCWKMLKSGSVKQLLADHSRLWLGLKHKKNYHQIMVAAFSYSWLQNCYILMQLDVDRQRDKRQRETETEGQTDRQREKRGKSKWKHSVKLYNVSLLEGRGEAEKAINL